MVQENSDSNQLDTNFIKNNFNMKKYKLKIKNKEKTDNPGIFMLRKDYLLSNLLAKKNTKLLDPEEKVILDLHKQYDHNNLIKGLIVEKISEPKQIKYLNLPLIFENENQIKMKKSKTFSKYLYNYKKLIAINKLHRRQTDSRNMSMINIDHVIKLNPLEDTVEFKLSKNKESESLKSKDKEKISTLNNYNLISNATQKLADKKLFKSQSINANLTKEKIFKTSIFFGIKEKSNFKSPKIIKDKTTTNGEKLYLKNYTKTTSGR